MIFRRAAAIISLVVCGVLWASAALAAIEVLEASYRPDRMLPEYNFLWNTNYRWGDPPPTYTASGQLCVYLKNTGTSSVTISDVQLQGVSLKQAFGCYTAQKYQSQLCYACSIHYPSSNPITSAQRQTLIDAGEPVWWRVTPATIPAGGTAEVYVRMRTRVLTSLSLTIVPSSGSSVPVSITVTDNDIPRIAGCALSPDSSQLYLYLRHMQFGKAPSQIVIDGVDVTAQCTIATDSSLDIVPVICNLPTAFARGSFHCFQATYDDGTRASAGLRVFYDDFKCCIWGGLGTATNAQAAAYINDLGAHMITTQVRTALACDDYMDSAAGQALMDQYGITRLADGEWQASGRFWGAFLCDEPDCAEKNVTTAICPAYATLGSMAQSLWYRADGFRTSNPTVPTFLNVDSDNRPYDWYHYAQIPDIFQSDPYITHRLRDAYWNRPQTQATHTKMTYVYGWSRTCKAACEPRPYHCIINCARIQEATRVWRWSTPEEHRIQAYYAIAAGATQLSHWQYTPKLATDVAHAGAGTPEPAAAAIWREIGLINAEFETASSVLVKSSPVQMPVKTSPRLWARALIGGMDTLTLVCVNDDFSAIDTGTLVRPITDASISLDVPGWLAAPLSVFEIDYNGVRDVPYYLTGRRLSLDLGRVEVTRLIIVTSDMTLKDTLLNRYNTNYSSRVSNLIGTP